MDQGGWPISQHSAHAIASSSYSWRTFIIPDIGDSALRSHGPHFEIPARSSDAHHARYMYVGIMRSDRSIFRLCRNPKLVIASSPVVLPIGYVYSAVGVGYIWNHDHGTFTDCLGDMIDGDGTISDNKRFRGGTTTSARRTTRQTAHIYWL